MKGVARHAAWCEWNEEKDENRKVEIAKQIARVFGYPTNDASLDKFLEDLGDKERRSGCVSFWAAIPKGKASLVTDIVNCHHKDYYNGSKPDAYDDEKLIPVFFPAVEKGATFLFTLVPMRGAANEDLQQAKAWLIKAITESGVGAKTSAGYGWFDYSKEAEEKRAKDAEAKRECERLEKERSERAGNLTMRIAEFDKKSVSSEDFKKEGQDLNSDISAFNEWAEKNGLPVLSSDLVSKFEKKKNQRAPVSAESLLNEWEGKSAQDCALTHYVMQFKAKSEKDKAEIVSVLRTHEVWRNYLRAGNFTDLKKKHQAPLREQVNAIREFAKTMPEGKMP